ncbi:MAG: VWA domain-containing protein [Lachnospiraceae bacterium]|nr:VWA domain-containing protein [Lachnospiraceae bacterium]
MRKRIPRRILTAALSLAMLLTLLPATALADGDTGETTTSGIELSKTATLENDGTYTIDLEAYATGETTTTTVETNVPLDIVLVLDQSGSMAYNFSGSSPSTNSERRQYAMKQAVNSFIGQVADKYSDEADHRMAIVTFGSSASTLQGWTTVDASGKNTLQSAVSGLPDSPSGATNVAAGMTQAQSLITNSNYTGENTERQAVVIVFTDGVPTTSSEFSTSVADSAIATAKTMKDSGVTIYTVGIFNGADPEQLYGEKADYGYYDDVDCDGTVGSVWGASGFVSSDTIGWVDAAAGNRFLNYLSSNFAGATSVGLESGSYNPGEYFLGSISGYKITANFDRTSSSYYLTADTADALSGVFTSISQDVSSSSTTVTLDENSVMKDIMADGFTLTSDSTVTIKTVAGTSDGTTITWGAETASPEGVKAEISDDKTTVSVTGFDYAKNYISSGHAGEKICVTIKGVLPTTDVTTGDPVSTNAATSGIYADATAETAAAYFPVPDTIITKKLYVLDYAKTATLTDLDQDKSVTGIVDTYKSVSSSDNALTQAYGTSSLSSNTLTYTPTTMSWNGYDSFYVFGQTTNSTVTDLEANSNGNLWSKVSVIPANNVYYEDDFITTSTDGTTSTGTVGIEYSKDNWTVVSGNTSTGSNTETANGDTYGWEESLSNDDTYSNGTATASGTAGATATFTFTGTGVDIYSRTDMYTGNVKVTLKGTSEGNTTSKVYICDNESVSGTYYQIPTVSFEDLEYDTYTVTIKVATNATNGNYTYYLDGVRVYNPLGTVTEEDGDSYEAYKADNELNAVFTEVRNILIDANSFTADYDGAGGVVFIDNIPTEEGTGETTTNIATYTDYGPENEVYLAAGQSIAFKVNTEYDHFYLGLKSADGLGTKATVTNGTGTSELTISHTTDLYYEITPTSNGYIMVKNTGSNLLSITKLRATSAVAVDTSKDVEEEDTTAIALLSAEEVDEILVYAASFDSLETVAYTGTGVDEDSAVDTGDAYEDLDGDDVVIDNPTEDTEEEPEETEAPNSLQSLFSNLFSTIRSWFSGRR